jgi:hypothetical protein
MPIHRSITRINRNENKYNAINICCCILLCYIIFSIFLSSIGLSGITIFCIIIGTTACGGCVLYICVTQLERERERERDIDEIIYDVDNVPTVTAYPLPDNYTDHVTLEAVVCDPDDSI